MPRNPMFARLSTLIITAFVDMIGILMVVPLMPFYARKVGASSMMIAVLVTSFTAAQLLSAPLWGRVSDRYGRRPALIIGLAGAAVAYIVFAYATSIWLLLLSRIVQGAGGGTTGVVQAYIADTVEPEGRAKALGWLSAATNVGVALGPPIGSVALHHFGQPGPGLLAATLCVINIVFAWRFLSESRDMSEANQTPRKPGASWNAIVHVITHSTAAAPRLIWIYAITMGAFSAVSTVLAIFVADKFGVGPDDIWVVFTFMGTISVIMRAGILGRAVDRYGEVALARTGLVLLTLGLALFPLAPTYYLVAPALAMIPVGTALTFPCVTSLLSRVILSHERGLYMGVQQTFGGLTRVLIPMWAGYAYDHYGHGVPFWTSAALVFGVMFLGIGIDDPRKPRVPVVAAAA